MGTQIGYSRRVSKSRYTPPSPEVEKHVKEVVDLFLQQQQIQLKYKSKLADLTSSDGDAVPIAYIAEQLGVERKTVYRHLGRSMT